MKITVSAAIATAAVAGTIALPATAHAGVPPAFQTPSGNIMCWMAENTAACRIVDYTYTVQQLPADCTSPGWPSTFWLQEGEPPSLKCNQDPPGSYHGLRAHTTLDYGQTRSVGVMTCDSEPSGVKCTDTGTGHFFRVASDSYELG